MLIKSVVKLLHFLSHRRWKGIILTSSEVTLRRDWEQREKVGRSNWERK